jgi:hypothetical protein
MKLHELQPWLQERLPAQLLAGAPEVAIYDDEVVIMLPVGAEQPSAEVSDEQRESVLRLIAQRREETRALRMRLAQELQAVVGRPVAWGMRVGAISALFTTRTAPVMTRLGRAERDVLDTLVAAGVADTRSSALAYTVRAFAAEHADWLSEVREAIEQVDQVRARLKLRRRAGVPKAEVVDEEADEDRG